MKHPMELMGKTLNTLDANFLQLSDSTLKALKVAEQKLIAANDQEKLAKLRLDIAKLEKMQSDNEARIRERLTGKKDGPTT